MGAWIMTLLAKEDRQDRIGGLLGIASAPDFTCLIKESIQNNAALSSQMNRKAYCHVPTEYDNVTGYYRIYKEVLEEAKTHMILQSSSESPCSLSSAIEFDFDYPVRLLHGKKDVDIPYEYSEALFSKIKSPDKELIFLNDGDHRLSKPDEIEIILKSLKDIIQI